MLGANSCVQLRAGDMVAVMAWDAMFVDEADEITTVREAGSLFIVLADGRTYSTWDGIGSGKAFGTRIRPARIRDEMALAVMSN